MSAKMMFTLAGLAILVSFIAWKACERLMRSGLFVNSCTPNPYPPSLAFSMVTGIPLP